MTSIIVDLDDKRDFLVKHLNNDTFILSIESMIDKNLDICIDEVFSTLDSFKSKIKESSNIYISSNTKKNDAFLIHALIDYYEINEFYLLDYDLNNMQSVKEAIEYAKLVDFDTVEAIKAEYRINKIFRCEISKVIQWYLHKEDLATNLEISKINLSFGTMIALDKIIKAEEAIESYVPEELVRVGITYEYQGVQFIAKNKKRFFKRQQSEIDLMMRQVEKPENLHFVKDFKLSDKQLPPPEPLTTNILENIGVTRFKFGIDETIKIANELRTGTTIKINGKSVGPLITPIHTNSTRIHPDAKYQIVNFIHNNFGDQYVFNGARLYDKNNSLTSDNKEAIRPLNFTKEYYPISLKPYMSEEQFMVYSMIFFRTIATQMADAVLDVSQVIVTVAGLEFKAESYRVKTTDDHSRFDGWLKISALFGPEEADFINEDIVLPRRLYSGQQFLRSNGEILSVKTYRSDDRRPPRFGEGRLKTQLIKEGIISLTSNINIISECKTLGLAKSALGMLHPTMLGRKIYYTLYEYGSYLFSEQTIKEYNLAIEEIKTGALNKKVIIDKFYLLLNQFKTLINYKDTTANSAPEEWLISHAKKIAAEKKQILNDSVLANRKSLLYYIAKNDIEIERLGTCPLCKSAKIYEKDNSYYCDNDLGCNFELTKSKISYFFDYFGKHIDDHDFKEIIKIILEYKKCRINGFYSKKKESNFNADIYLVFNQKFRQWELSFYNTGADVKKGILVAND